MVNLGDKFFNDDIRFYEISLHQYTIPTIKDSHDFDKNDVQAYSITVPSMLSYRQVVGQPLLMKSNKVYNQNFYD